MKLMYVNSIRWSSRRITILALEGHRREAVPTADSRGFRNGGLYTFKSITPSSLSCVLGEREA